MKNIASVRAHIFAGASFVSLFYFGAAAQAQDAGANAVDPAASGEIVVTATRQSESISKVPISIAAFDNKTLQRDGVKRVDDLVRFTPGLALNRGPTGANQVAIRGISSTAGAGVTGIYIDEAPIQVRNEGYGSGSAFPEVFDLERVEVLRGPQGTLFGAGSEGGTVRFIQAAPNMDGWKIFARGEAAATEKGAASYEGGVAVGGPILADRIAFRASVYYRKNGGYIDAVEGTYAPATDANGNAPAAVYPNGNLVDFTKTRTVRQNANSDTALTARLAVELRPTEWLTLTPSVSYQRTHQNDGTGSFWTASSNISSHDFSRVVFSSGNPATNSALISTQVPDAEPATDKFTLWALNAKADLGGAELVSNSSYFHRTSDKWLDFTLIDAFQFGGFAVPPAGFKSGSLYQVGQKNFVQEVRLQSTDRNARLRWVLGAFYSENRQSTQQNIFNNFVDNLPVVMGVPAGGSPFGAGTSAIVNALGVPQLPGGGSYSEDRRIRERQYAAFAQVDLRVIDTLTLTLGARVSRNDLGYDGVFRGPLNNDNVPMGAACPTVGGCTPGTGVFAPVYQDTLGVSKKQTSFTPKVGLAWQATPRDLFYATVSKGFRPAGVNSKVPGNFCGADLALTGYANSSGGANQPITYNSDSVWSYEVGAKNKLLGGRLSLDGSAYVIKWSNIQNAVALPTCLYSFVDNLGNATAKGFDLAVNVEPVDGLHLGTTVSYNKATYDANVVTPGNVVLARGGSAISDARPWTLTLVGEYDFDKYYVRADGSYFAEARRIGTTDPQSPLYNANLRPSDSYTMVNLRAGVRTGPADVSLFVNNATNTAPVLNAAAQIGGFVYTANTVRPRTYGITVSWRQ